MNSELKQDTQKNIDFSSLESIVNNDIYNESYEIQMRVYNYLSQFDDKHIKAYNIAREHLQTSFDIVKSIGFINYLKKIKKEEEEEEKKQKELQIQQQNELETFNKEDEEEEKQKEETNSSEIKKKKPTIKLLKKTA